MTHLLETRLGRIISILFCSKYVTTDHRLYIHTVRTLAGKIDYKTLGEPCYPGLLWRPILRDRYMIFHTNIAPGHISVEIETKEICEESQLRVSLIYSGAGYQWHSLLASSFSARISKFRIIQEKIF